MFPGLSLKIFQGSRKPDSQRIVEVSKLAGIHDFILKFPLGYDSY